MKPARVDFVSACETCPFCSPAYDLGDFCQNTTLPGGGYRPIDGGIDSDPPDWCPLREGPSLVVLANRK